MQHYLKYFDRDHLKVYLFEDLINDPEALFADLFQYLGVDPTFRVDVRIHYNESRAARSKTVERILRPSGVVVRNLMPLMPKRWRETVNGKIFILYTLNLRPKPKMSREEREELIELYRDAGPGGEGTTLG